MGFTQLWRRVQRLCLMDERRMRLIRLTTDQVYHDCWHWQGQNPPLHPPAKKRLISPSLVNASKRNVSYSLLPCTTNASKNFKERIESMLYYAEEADFCRSKVLLHYFGEKDAPPANNVTFAGNGNLIRIRMLRTNKSSHLYWRL